MAHDPTIDVRNLQEFFRDSVHAALERQRVEVEDHTEHYVVNLLTMFARSEALFDGASGRPQLKPLALMLAEAGEAPTREDRLRTLQRLGDVSLFMAGFFAQGFARRLVEVEHRGHRRDDVRAVGEHLVVRDLEASCDGHGRFPSRVLDSRFGYDQQTVIHRTPVPPRGTSRDVLPWGKAPQTGQ